MSIIAIDPSLNYTGWCIATNTERIASGVIRTKGDSISEKLAFLAEELENVLVNFGIRVEKAIIEVPASFPYARSTGRFGKQLNVAALLKLSRAIGVVMLICYRFGIVCVEIEATQWKGKMGKKVATMVAGVKNNNEADAILLAQFWFHVMKIERR